MFGSLGAPELLFILGLALLIFGPSKLPELGRTMGKAMAEFRKAATDFKRTLNAEALEREMRDADPRRAVNDTLAKAKKELDAVMHADERAEKTPPSPAQAEDGPGAEPSKERSSSAGTVARGSERDETDAAGDAPADAAERT